MFPRHSDGPCLQMMESSSSMLWKEIRVSDASESIASTIIESCKRQNVPADKG